MWAGRYFNARYWNGRYWDKGAPISYPVLVRSVYVSWSQTELVGTGHSTSTLVNGIMVPVEGTRIQHLKGQ